MTTYLLAKHVFLCMRGSNVVFLDLKEDKYLSMDAAKVSRVLALPANPSKAEELAHVDVTQSLGDPASQKSAQALIRKGLLTTDRAAGKEVVLATIEDPESDLVGIAPVEQPKVRLIDAVRFAAATVSAWVALRFGSLEAIVSKVSERRLKHLSGVSEIDLHQAQLSLFERMRPYVFSARDKCLFESFVLNNFLARYNLYPEWVFGVTTNPFAAHCWLQYGRVVFNDYAEHASEFTPILVI
jgi:hypothetical protein